MLYKAGITGNLVALNNGFLDDLVFRLGLGLGAIIAFDDAA